MKCVMFTSLESYVSRHRQSKAEENVNKMKIWKTSKHTKTGEHYLPSFSYFVTKFDYKGWNKTGNSLISYAVVPVSSSHTVVPIC